MATTNTGISKFKAQFGGGARVSLFECRVNFPGLVIGDRLTEQASFLVKASSGIPASTITAIDVPFRGRNLKVAGDRANAEPWQITVLNDVDFNLRDAFENWMNGIENHESSTSDFPALGYYQNMELRQLDKDESVLKTYTFVDAFPTAVSAIALDAVPDGGIQEFTVDFSYQYWTAAGVTS